MTIDLKQDECEHILSIGRYGHLGCIHGDEPYVVPITYVYRNKELFGFTHEGKKIEAMRLNAKVCVQVEDVMDGHSWVSVICFGTFEEIKDSAEMQRVKMFFAQQYGESVKAGEIPPVSPGIERMHYPMEEGSVLYRVKPYRITGKRDRS